MEVSIEISLRNSASVCKISLLELSNFRLNFFVSIAKMNHLVKQGLLMFLPFTWILYILDCCLVIILGSWLMITSQKAKDSKVANKGQLRIRTQRRH